MCFIILAIKSQPSRVSSLTLTQELFFYLNLYEGDKENVKYKRTLKGLVMDDKILIKIRMFDSSCG